MINAYRNIDTKALQKQLERSWEALPVLISQDRGRREDRLVVLGKPQLNTTDDWQHTAYEVELRAFGKSLKSTYCAGLGVDLIPTAQEIVASLVRDAMSVLGETFETWAFERNLDTDSRKAEQTFRTNLDIRLWFEAHVGLGIMRAVYEAEVPEDRMPLFGLYRREA